MRDDQLMQHNDFTSAREKVTPSQDTPGHEKQVTVEVWPGHMLSLCCCPWLSKWRAINSAEFNQHSRVTRNSTPEFSCKIWNRHMEKKERDCFQFPSALTDKYVWLNTLSSIHIVSLYLLHFCSGVTRQPYWAGAQWSVDKPAVRDGG